VIDLRLTGRLNLNRIALDQTLTAQEIQSAAEVFAVAIDLAGLDVGGFLPGSELAARGFSREELEKNAIREVVASKRLWGIGDREDDFSAFCYELKEAVRKQKSGTELTEQIACSPLLDRIAAPDSTPGDGQSVLRDAKEEAA
jgi:hypothetical protein